MKSRKARLVLGGVLLSAIVTAVLWSPSEPLDRPVAVAPSHDSETKVAADVAAISRAEEDQAAAKPVPDDFGAWAREPMPKPDFSRIEAFDGWVARWRESSPEERAAMSEEGIRLATARRPEFKSLIVVNPRLALEKAVPRVVRQDLPEDIVAQLESPVSAAGTLNVYQGRPAEGFELRGDQLTMRYFEAGGTSYKARVFGELEYLTTRPNLPLRGVAVDREMAVAENAVRPLETGEIIPAGTVVEETCPVSGETTEAVSTGEAVTGETPTVEIAGRVITLCNGSHVTVLEDEFRTWVQASGPGGAGFFVDNFPGTSSRAIGNLRCLYIRVTYPEQMAAPNTEEEAYSDMKNVARYYLESSYGKMTTTTTVTSLVTLPHTMAWYKAKDAAVDGLGLIHNDSRAGARALGYDSSQYDCTIVRVEGGPRLEGISWGGGSSVWITWGGMDVLNHECGHSLGRNHANYWNTSDGTAYGNGENAEYGNPFDVMGGSGGFSAHYNTISKRALGWLPDAYVHQPKVNGVFRLHAYDQPQLEEGKRYALTVAKDGVRQYNVEYHPARGGLLADTALVIYSGMGSNAGHLLDTTPGSAGGKNDGGIAVGRTFSDLEADMHFTVIGKNATSPPSLDVAYFRGPFPGNVAPAVSLGASATTIAAGGSVTFTATASDANGDALAYQWDFDDGTSAANSAVVTRTFATVSQVTAMVTVSDMKGGVTRRHLVINVGSHGRQTVAGNITWNAAPLQGVRVSNGVKYAYTDADGNYALSGLATGAHTLTPTLSGFLFSPASSPVTVIAGTNTANFTAANSTFVTLAAVSNPTEGGANGSFTLTRTGATTADLVVKVSPASGSATKNTDYNFSPNYLTDGDFRTFTIPAGQASLTVTVSAVNDSSSEGPETINLQLASNGNYLSNSANAMAMTLVDNDTSLPQVSVVSNDPYASESPAEVGTFTFSRIGSTAAALNLSVGWTTGTATQGSDFATLSSPVTIPAGQSSVTVNVTPLNDSAIEVPETVIASLNTSSAYVRGAAQSATVTISDDDTPVVTVSVPDAAAAEAGQDSGVFLITRSGSTAAALKVYYGVHGTAFHGTDYAALNGEVIIPAGSASAPVVITPYNDEAGESPETVVLAVTTFNNGYSLGPLFQGTVTIADNADVPVISLRAGSIGTEGGSNASVIFRAVGATAGNVSVNYTVSGTATSGTDFTALSGTVSIPANGSNDITVNIPVANDLLAESTETVIVKITPSASYRVYNSGSAEAIIRDNDSGGDRVMVSNFNQSPAESGATGSFYFSRTGSTGALLVNYAVSGTATNGSDYAALPGSIVIPDGATGVDLLMAPTDDALVEGTETVTLTVLPGTGYGPDRPASASYEIADSETPAITVGFQSSTATASETAAGGEYRDGAVVLSAASPDTVTVNYLAGGGGSATGDDVDWGFVTAANAPVPGGTLTFAPGITSQNLRIRVKNDGLIEGVETAVLRLQSPRFASPGIATQSIAIFDDAVATPMAVEERWAGGTVYNNQSWGSVTPEYSGTLFGFTTAVDVDDDYSRRVVGQIVAPATGTYNFWIASDDASRLYLSTTPLAANKVLIAQLTSYTDFQNWDANGSQKSGNITLTAGQSYYMEVQHQEGGGGDHASVAWSGPGFTRTPVTQALPESTAPRFVRLATASSTRRESDGTEPLLMAMLDRPAGSTAVTVPFTVSGTAVSGSDFTLAPGTLTFAAGEQMKLLPLSLLTDAAAEGPEVIVVSLGSPTGAQLASPSSQVITLLDANAPSVEALYATATTATAAGTVLGTAVATAGSGRSITGWSILAGNAGNRFAINAAGQVTLVTGSGLPNPGGVQLVVRATDNLGASGDGLVNVVCNAPAGQGVVEQRWAGSGAFDGDVWTGTTSYSGTRPNFTTAQDVGDNYSRRLTGYLKPQTTGDYTFWIAGDDDCRLFLSSDGLPANKVHIASVDGWTSYQVWDEMGSQKSAVIPLVAGQVYWMEVHHKEGGGGDHVSVAWSGPGISRVAIPATVIFPNVAGLNFSNPPVPPTLALTSPGEGAAFVAGDNVTLNANVAGGSIVPTSVEFYRGATLIGSDASAPYTATWSGATTGTHALTARAVYPGGGVSSSAVTIAVTNPDPAADPDGDGFPTGLEVALGTNPNSSSSQPPAIYANLRAWWKLDEVAGTVADDTTGRTQDGTVSGAAWSSGISGGALSFDGVDDGVLVGTAAALTGAGNFSLAAWVKVDPGSPLGTVIQQREPGALGNQGIYHLNVNTNGTVNFLVAGTLGTQFDLTTAAAVNDGQWHHLSAVRNGTSGKIYIDGIEAASATGNAQALVVRAVALGYDARDINKRLDGSLDDVRIYERALSAAEIDGLHDALVPNRAPAFAADPVVKSPATEDAAYSGSLAADASDPDFGDTVTFLKVSGPDWLSVASNGALSGTPTNAEVGPNSFQVRVTDPAGLTDQAALSIMVANSNDAPVFAVDPISGGSATEDQPFTGSVAGTASDADAGDTLTYSKGIGPGWLNVAPNGALSGTPGNDDVGTNAFTVIVTDSGNATDEAALSITIANVNDAPAFTADPIAGPAATEDQPYSGSLAGLAGDIDAGDTLAFEKVDGPPWLTIAPDGTLGGIPSNADAGSNSFNVRVKDVGNANDVAVLNITVANVNDAPVFTVDPILRAAGTEEAAYAGASLAGTAADADAGDAITYSVTAGPPWLAVAPDGSLSGTPPAGSAGSNVFTVRATDVAGDHDEATLTIEIQGDLLPLPWDELGIGTGNLAGSTSHTAGTFTVAGSGELTGRNDTLNFAWQTLSGDGRITARIASLENTGTSSRVGVMIRDTLASNSRHVFMGLTGDGGYRWVRRTGLNGNTSTSKSGSATVPDTWVRLVRSGNVVTAFKSADGVTWTQVGSLTAAFPANCYFGLAVASGSNATLNSSQFSNVSITP